MISSAKSIIACFAFPSRPLYLRPINTKDSASSYKVRDNVTTVARMCPDVPDVLLNMPRAPGIGQKYNRLRHSFAVDQILAHGPHHGGKTQ
jgi:hypothetical protein